MVWIEEEKIIKKIRNKKKMVWVEEGNAMGPMVRAPTSHGSRMVVANLLLRQCRLEPPNARTDGGGRP